MPLKFPAKSAVVSVLAVILTQFSQGAYADVSSTQELKSNGTTRPFAYPPLDQIIDDEFLPKLDVFFDELLTQGKDLTLDGTRAFNGEDKFLPGKIAIGLSYLLLNTPQDSPQFERYLEGYREIADMTIDMRNETWGIYYYMSALNRLKQAGLLEKAISQDTLDELKEKTDWRQFVDQDDFSLIDLPTNYYGVAFSIARLRYELGWEDKSGSEKLLQKMMDHYREYSGEYGFSDETNGQGRFDRYSILLIGEICQRFIETGMEVTPQMKKWLRNSVDVVLMRLNQEGHGFSYGRSIGAYGDTAFLEVLSAAAYLDVLTAEEKAMAYAFAARAAERYAEFWFDDEMQSVNLWEKGRVTDAYRGKYRILGENLSLSHQMIYTANLWKEMGYKGRIPTNDFEPWLEELPEAAITWFARGEYDRALVTYRDRGHVISLPLINGGESKHDKIPYYPVPFANGMLEGTPDESYPQLLPRFTLADGTELIPTSFFRDVEAIRDNDTVTVTYRQDEMDRVGKRNPIKDDRLEVDTRYEFSPGQITRRDTYRSSGNLDLSEISMAFASFSRKATIEDNTVSFGEGDITSFSVEGLDACRIAEVGDRALYQSPVGAMQTLVTCESDNVDLDDSLTLSWTLNYTQ